MIGTRWRKVLSDLWSNNIRTLLAVFSIAVGIFSIGSLASRLPTHDAARLTHREILAYE